MFNCEPILVQRQQFQRSFSGSFELITSAILAEGEHLGTQDGSSELFVSLNSAGMACLHQLVAKCNISDGAGDELFNALRDFNDRCCRDREQHRTKGALRIARAYHQSIAIIYNLAVKRRGAGHATNESFVNGINRCLRSTSDAEWKPLPYLRIWM